MVGRQNVPIHLRWAAMLPTLRTTGLDYQMVEKKIQQLKAIIFGTWKCYSTFMFHRFFKIIFFVILHGKIS